VLDSGTEAAKQVIMRLFASQIEAVVPEVAGIDSKTLLQEWLQGQKLALPVYELIGQAGAGHALTFEVRCTAQGKSETAKGTSRKLAEREAARRLLDTLGGV
jgi:ribonuclease-3